MAGETNLVVLLKTMKPTLNAGEYVFCTTTDFTNIDFSKIISFLKEEEGYTIILEKKVADSLNFSYAYVASWITLTVNSSLEAIGLTAAFSAALAKENISCNVIAGYYHDHIFVDKKDTENAIKTLNTLSNE